MPKPIDTVSRQKPAATPAATEPAATETAAAAVEEAPVETVEPTAEDSYDSLFPEPSITLNPPPSWIWWFLALVGSVALGYMGFVLLRSNVDQWLTIAPPRASVSQNPANPSVTLNPTVPSAPTTTSPSTTSAATPTPTATPTATSSVDKKAVTLRVLNGTSQAGAAATVKKVLEQQGFTVRTIGNAKQQTYTQTVIYYQEGRRAEAEAVQKSLGDYTPVLEQSALASPDMVLVVIGS